MIGISPANTGLQLAENLGRFHFSKILITGANSAENLQEVFNPNFLRLLESRIDTQYAAMHEVQLFVKLVKYDTKLFMVAKGSTPYAGLNIYTETA